MMDSKVTLKGCLFGLVGAALIIGSIVVFSTHQGENFTTGWLIVGFGMLIVGIVFGLQVIYAGRTEYGCSHCGTALYIPDPDFHGVISCPSCNQHSYMCTCKNVMAAEGLDPGSEYSCTRCGATLEL